MNKYFCSLIFITFIKVYAQDSIESKFHFKEELTSPFSHQEINSENKLTWYQMFTHVPNDILSFPAGVLNSNKLLIGALAAGTGTLMFLDETSWRDNTILFHNSNVFHKLSDVGVTLGEAKYHFMMAGLFSVLGFALNDQRALKTASNLVEVAIASGISAQVLKRIFGRESPAAATEYGGDWTFLPSIKEYQKNQAKYYSYPSGHITTLTASVTVIANNYPKEKWIKPVGYFLVALCGVGLVSRGMHWYSDLPVGFFLGYTFGNIVSPQESDHTQKEEKTAENKLNILPLFDPNDLGFALSYNF
jgi:membrane-associated phospholipid phosphatase